MSIQLYSHKNTLKGTIHLPASKSISNRALIINALSYNPNPIKNLSDSDDTKVLTAALYSNNNHFDIGHAGTAMRFLTAYLSKIVGEWTISGSNRMHERPINILVDALKILGAKIEYLQNTGYPPIKIFGSHLKGKTLELDGSISSQFISALLLIAPTLENGLTIILNGDITSRSYIEMTLKIMEHFGVYYQFNDNKISIAEQQYLPLEFTVESDWSGASYFYELLALADSGEIMLKGLSLNSLQGDSIISQWCEQFGIQSIQENNNVILKKLKHIQPKKLELNFKECPDIAQTMVCLCAGLKVPFLFDGLETLKIKETDRIMALQTELIKFGINVKESKRGCLLWNGKVIESNKQEIPEIATYNDHRMAMAFAPLALINPIIIKNEHVVSKSYSNFWHDLKSII